MSRPKKEKPTRADEIRKMTDEQLAELLTEHFMCGIDKAAEVLQDISSGKTAQRDKIRAKNYDWALEYLKEIEEDFDV